MHVFKQEQASNFHITPTDFNWAHRVADAVVRGVIINVAVISRQEVMWTVEGNLSSMSEHLKLSSDYCRKGGAGGVIWIKWG